MYMDLFAAFSLALTAVGASVHSHRDMLRLFRLCGVVFCSSVGCGRFRLKDAVLFAVPKPFSCQFERIRHLSPHSCDVLYSLPVVASVFTGFVSEIFVHHFVLHVQ